VSIVKYFNFGKEKDVLIRLISLKLVDENHYVLEEEEKMLLHIQYLGWPDFGGNSD